MLPYHVPHVCARAQSCFSAQGSVFSNGNFHSWQAPRVGFFFFLTLNKLYVVTDAFSSFTSVQINSFNSYLTQKVSGSSLGVFVIFSPHQETPTLILGNPPKPYIFQMQIRVRRLIILKEIFLHFSFYFRSCACSYNSSWRIWVARKPNERL